MSNFSRKLQTPCFRIRLHELAVGLCWTPVVLLIYVSQGVYVNRTLEIPGFRWEEETQENDRLFALIFLLCPYWELSQITRLL